MSALLKSWVDEGVIKADTIYGLELLNEPATAWTPDLWDVIRDQFNYGGYDEVRKVFPDPNLKVVVQTGFRSYNDYDDYMQSPVSFDNRPKPCPFDLGLRKFAHDFVVVIFFKNTKKNYKWWSDYVLRKNWLDLTLFAKNIYVVKNTSSELT